MRALIVDDDLISRNLMLKYLRSYCDCDVAVSGDEATTAFQLAWNENHPYELILLDIVIPGKNGFEVLNTIREYEHRNDIDEKSVIIMVSALNDQRQVLNAYKSDCNGYVIKPLTSEAVQESCKDAGLKLHKRVHV